MAAARGLSRKAVDLDPVDTFVHRDFWTLLASVPALAVGSLALFVLCDRRTAAIAAGVAGAGSGGTDDALSGLAGLGGFSLRPDEELALTGIMLAVMAERLEHDPVAYPLLACAAARLVPAQSGRHHWTGLTERARRAAVEVLRPVALSTLVRAATWGLVPPAEQP